jgi:hypothetical protein
MRKYNVTLQLFAATGDDIDVDAINPQVAEQRARLIAEQRFAGGGYYDFTLQEITVDCVEDITVDAFAQPDPDRKVNICLLDGAGAAVENQTCSVEEAAQRVAAYVQTMAAEGLGGSIEFYQPEEN